MGLAVRHRHNRRGTGSRGARRRRARQCVTRRFGQDDAPLIGLKTTDKADGLLRAAHFVPRDPKAVRGAKCRFAKMPLQLIGGKDKLSRGYAILGVLVRVAIGVNRERAGHRNASVAIVGVEQHAAAEAADTRLARLV